MKPPRFITDLYADLRDRKMLPLVIVLVLATAALPILLGRGTEPIPPQPVAGETELPKGVPTPAVLASDPGLRDYRDRLDALRSKNPFAGEPASEGGGESAQVQSITEAAKSAGVPIGGGGSTGGDTTIEESIDASSSTTTDSVTIEDNSVSDSGNNNNNGGGGGSEVLAFRVDVEVGPAGDAQRRKNVKLLTVLPSQSNPVFLFLGASEDGKHAVFLVSDDVTAIRGDGRCVPTPADCQFLNMKKGDEMKAEYAPSGADRGQTFVLEVLDIRLEQNEETAEADRAERADPTDALQAWLGL